MEHLFLLCPLAAQFWVLLGLTIPAFNNPADVVASFRRQLNVTFFMEIIILGCWGIWMTHNDFIFRQIDPSVQNCRAHFKKELALAVHRAKNSIVDILKEWIDNHL